MKTTMLAVSLGLLIPATLSAQRYDYDQYLDSTATAARSALESSGHHASRARTRPDGVTESPFTIALPDSTGAPAGGELRVTMLSRDETIIRVFARATARGQDTTALLAAGRYFAERLTESFGRPASVDEGVNWCWATPRRFIDVTIDRSDELTLTVAFDRPLR